MKTATKNSQNNEQLVASKKYDIQERLKAINFAVNHFGDGEKLHWGHIGSLAKIQDDLKNIEEFLNIK